MGPYLGLISLPVLAQITQDRRASAFALAFVGLCYFLFIGFRFQVGPDWYNYERMVDRAAWSSLSQLVRQTEPGFGLLQWINTRLGFGQVGVNVCCAAVFCYGVFTLARQTASPWIAVAVATSFLLVACGMNTIRQSIAVGIIMIAVAHWPRMSLLQRGLLIVLASAFHFSALMMVACLAFEASKNIRVRLASFIVTAGAAFGAIALRPERADVYVDWYVTSVRSEADGAIYQVLLIAIPAVAYFVLRKRWNAVFSPQPVFLALAMMSLLMVPVIAFSTVAASRLSLYLNVFPMIFWAGLPFVLATPANRKQLSIAVTLLQVGIMVAWFSGASHVYAYVPYNNVILQPERSSAGGFDRSR